MQTYAAIYHESEETQNALVQVMIAIALMFAFLGEMTVAYEQKKEFPKILFTIIIIWQIHRTTAWTM